MPLLLTEMSFVLTLNKHILVFQPMDRGEDNEHTEQVMDTYFDTNFELSTDQLEHKDGHKFWTESRQKSLCCSSCTDKHESTPPSSYERHGLLIQTGSSDSACWAAAIILL